MENNKNDQRELSLNDLDAVSGGSSGGTVINSGSFVSNTGTKLNIMVSWSVVAGGLGQKTLEVQVSAVSYSLVSSALNSGVELTVNGMVYAQNSSPVNYRGNAQVANVLASFSIPNLSGTVNLSAVWHFRGTYSGIALDDIRASGIAVV